MRKAITALELLIGSVLLVGCLVISMDGVATSLQLIL